MKTNTTNALSNRPETKRNSVFELLRIISMLMIVASHFATHGGFVFDNQTITFPRIWCNILIFGGNFGVDIFILISGYFLIENKKLELNFKKIFKFWGQVFFYSVAIFLFSFIIDKGKTDPISIVKTFLPITFSQWWFASTYFVLFLIHPYINRLLHSLEKKQYQGFLILLMVIWSVIPTFTTSDYQSNPLLQFVLFYSIAGYIRIYGLNKKIKSKHYFALWGIFTFVTYLSSLIFVFLGTKYPIFSSHANYFYERARIPTILSAVCFFMAFATLTPFYKKTINTLASATFGVYLIHDSNIIRPFLWKEVFKNAQYQNNNAIILYSLIVIIWVYVICSIIELIRQFIDRPVSKFINKNLNKLLFPFVFLCNKIKWLIFGKSNF